MISEILRVVVVLEGIENAASERVLVLAQRVEGQRAQKMVLDNI